MWLDKLHDIAAQSLSDQLKQLGFDLDGDVSTLSLFAIIRRLMLFLTVNGIQAISTLFPHHVGHYLGLDLHDTPGYSRKERLRAGHCITIEP
jgi:intermediate cleaving peptidase 55